MRECRRSCSLTSRRREKAETQFDELLSHAMAQLGAAEEDGPIIFELRLPPKPAHLLLRARQDRGS
jgi:hypothetical protein